MPWYNPFTWRIVTGVDLAAEEDRRRSLEAWEAELDRKAAERRIWDEQAQEIVARQRAADAAAWGSGTNYEAQVTAAAVEGAREGLRAAQQTFRDTLTGAAGGVTRGVLGFVPWWAWLIGLGYLAWRLGWLPRLRLPVPR